MWSIMTAVKLPDAGVHTCSHYPTTCLFILIQSQKNIHSVGLEINDLYTSFYALVDVLLADGCSAHRKRMESVIGNLDSTASLLLHLSVTMSITSAWMVCWLRFGTDFVDFFSRVSMKVNMRLEQAGLVAQLAEHWPGTFVWFWIQTKPGFPCPTQLRIIVVIRFFSSDVVAHDWDMCGWPK